MNTCFLTCSLSSQSLPQKQIVILEKTSLVLQDFLKKKNLQDKMS